jgi:MinD-like ATPase involved in chromosome partitioning or flagellar assembly
VELPTYTSIWRIEKRLYKLYDFRLPMPVPVGQIIVFGAITAPYVLLLTTFGVPLDHSLFWLYVLPPGALTWLATRPVLESKRLPELVISQVRYLVEPKVWCRLAPLAARDRITVVARVRQPAADRAGTRVGESRSAVTGASPHTGAAAVPESIRGRPREAALTGPAPVRQAPAVAARPAVAAPVPSAARLRDRDVAGNGQPRTPGRDPAARAAGYGQPRRPGGAPPVVLVPVSRGAVTPAPVRPAPPVERALGGPADERSVSWRDRVSVAPGAPGPRRPDFSQRDTARATAALEGSRLVAVLGCTVGAGQTMTTLMLGEVLARVRGEPVAALDLNPGPAALAAGGGAPGRGGRLDVLVHDVADDPDPGPQALRALLTAVATRYGFTLADPAAAHVAGLLAVADQLIMVGPASPEAPGAVAMTHEWLTANGFWALARNAIVVINGVSKRSLPHAAQAEMVVHGRCRAIVRIPWDDHLAEPRNEHLIRASRAPAGSAGRSEQLRLPVRHAYTALAGVLVAAVAQPVSQRGPVQRRAAL